MEMDAYCASKLAGYAANAGSYDTTTLSAANILTNWDLYLQYMTDMRVNRDRVIAYMTPAIYKLLKEASGITRFIDTGTGIRNIDRNVGRLDGVNVVEVPSDVMKQVYDFTVGWTPVSGQVNLLMVDPMAVVAPVVYETSMISAPDAQSKGKYLYYERYYYDVFALNKRAAGLFANINTATNVLGTLTVTSVAGSTSGDSKVSVTAGTSGLGNTAFFYIAGASPTAPTAGTAITVGAGNYAPFVSGEDYTLTSGQTVQVVEANADTLQPISYGTATIVVAA